ncbi:MAG TPA: amino acid adenylation domain-containing protein [Candidatus Angelobacter sp.]|jgi:amino acid adenylation domain-containing protein|nr:amino acid adenylation domain-containing protein [Candidatus Angelobacter sp.]
MSFAQQRLWFLEQLTGGLALYNMPCPQRFMFPIDEEVLRRSVNEIVRRHETLRTTFALVDGASVQVVAPELELVMPVEDLRSLSPEERDQESLRISTEHALEPFDLRNGPLIRAKLLRLAEADYLFLLTIHHIVSDGWSLGVFLGELGVLYGAFITGQPSPLPELQIQYSDFSEWQRNWLKGEVLERQLGYWKSQLSSLTTLDLPCDRTRPALPSFQGASHPIELDLEVINRLRLLCAEQDATLFMMLLAAFQSLLFRYTGQEDVVVGSPVANRNRTETEALIGFFVNSLVMRTNLGGDPTFRQLLGRVRETALGAYANQDLPFEMLVDELHPERDLSRNPLFQVVFQLMSTSAIVKSGDGGTSGDSGQRQSTPALQMGTAKFDLNLTLFESQNAVLGAFEYNTDLFDSARIKRMAGHYAKLLEEIARDPGQRISRLQLLTAAELRQIQKEWNATAAPFPRHEGVREAFERHAAKHPEATAIIFENKELPFGEVESRASQLANYLQEQGVRKGAVVAICLPRSPEMIIAALAAFKAGAAYLPIDPAYPDERIQLMVADAGAAAVVTTFDGAKRFQCEDRKLIALDQEASAIQQQPATHAGTGYDENALAYIIFTSGSTGKPKGVEISHQGLTNLVAWHNRTFNVEPGSRGMQFASIAFDAAVWEIWPYLAAGASITIVDEGVRYSPALLPQWISGHGVTHCFIPTPILDIVVRQPFPAEGSLRVMLTGGDKLVRGVPPDLPFSVFNQYGPTENTVVATSARVPSEKECLSAPPIGRPISNVELFVMDANGQPVPIGVVGELWIGGQSLARGYCNAPELTAGSFVQHPLQAGKSVYRTGDLVRYLPDGTLEFIGRADEQLKIRGFRIEPGEIESALTREPEVRSACVITREDTPGDPRLVAYIVANAGASVDTAMLRERLRDKLPAYMVPSALVVLETFPLTTNGKIDRQKLPAPPEQRARVHFVPPRTPLEEMVADAWRQEIHLTEVGIDDNFFDVGGNSLTLVRIQHRLEAKLPSPISVVDLFRYPTIRTLAASLNGNTATATKVEKARERALRRKQVQTQRRSEGISR